MVDSYSNFIKNKTARTDIYGKTKKEKKPKPVICYLGLGSNIGDSINNVLHATEQIDACDDITLLKSASLYQTKAWGKTDQEDFVNTVIKIETILTPKKLLTVLQSIETNMGRVRAEKWGPRIIDIDILLYGNNVVITQHLHIPHPYITERNFVLIPLAELDDELNIPNKGKIYDYICDIELKNNIKKLFL